MALTPTTSRGSSQPVTRESFTGGAGAVIANTEFGSLRWVKAAGDTLVTLTDPLAPVIVTAGVYAVAVYGQVGSVTVGGYWTGELDLDLDGDDQFLVAASGLSSVANSGSLPVSLSLTYYIPAGGVVSFSAGNFDGTSARTFTIISAYIQRLA
jgi:hypothetical protein